MNSAVQNEISRIRKEEAEQHRLEEAARRQAAMEGDARHKWVRISKGASNLHILCKVDGEGNVLSKELLRIKKIKKSLGIKE